MVPGAVLMPWRFQVSGIMVLFYGGEASGHGFAAALFGDVNPVGVPGEIADVPLEPDPMHVRFERMSCCFRISSCLFRASQLVYSSLYIVKMVHVSVVLWGILSRTARGDLYRDHRSILSSRPRHGAGAHLAASALTALMTDRWAIRALDLIYIYMIYYYNMCLPGELRQATATRCPLHMSRVALPVLGVWRSCR